MHSTPIAIDTKGVTSMTINEPSISIPTSDVKWVRAILTLFALKGFLRVFILVNLLLGVVTLFTGIALAVNEVVVSLSDMWAHSNSIVKLFLLVLAIYSVRKVVPYIVTLYSKGVI